MKKSGLAVARLALAVGLLAGILFIPQSQPAAADTTFPQTGFTIWGPFEQYWNAHGGLAQFGLPRTSVFPFKGADSTGYDAQWFERALFTYNPKNPDPYKVQLQLLGDMIAPSVRSQSQAIDDMFKPTGGGAGSLPRTYIYETQHNLVGKFYEYWQNHGGLAIYGYPISEAFPEKSKSDGKEYMVQYFERNRLEYHPELAGTPYEMQLGLLGSELLDQQGGVAAFSNLGNPLYYPARSGGSGGAGGTGGTGTSYPKTGRAPDYSWVAGQVVVTRIQGGCTFIQTGTESFSPNGQGWQPNQVKNGDYVVLFGHLAGPGEPTEICPGGKPYIVDKFMLNP